MSHGAGRGEGGEAKGEDEKVSGGRAEEQTEEIDESGAYSSAAGGQEEEPGFRGEGRHTGAVMRVQHERARGDPVGRDRRGEGQRSRVERV